MGDGQRPLSARIVILAVSTLVALASGTNYVFSDYSPQLADRLKITHTQLNIIGLAGNAGIYLTGPIFGRIADRKDLRILFASASLLLFLGYFSIRYFYIYVQPPLSTINFLVLVLWATSTGIGTNAGQTAALNANAKCWPESQRATANGIFFSGIGLSAFFFSTVSTFLFKGEPSSFLLLLAFGTTAPMILAFFVVKTVPRFSKQLRCNAGASETEHAPLLVNEENSESLMDPHTDITDRTIPPESVHASTHRTPDVRADLHIKPMFITADFWIIFISMSILAGTGLMYINNIGSIVQVLLVHDNPDYDQTQSLQNQAQQVSTISLCNFASRIVIGIIADFLKTCLNLPRSFATILISSTFLISQLALYNIETAENLWKASALLGVSYGMLYGLYPTLVLDWFGIGHFSENFGIVALSPAIAGNIFSILFGKNLDAHTPRFDSHTGDSTAQHTQCLDGRLCYIDTLHITILACCFTLGITTYGSWKDWKRSSDQSGWWP